ncbi:MAG: radical SAM protein, partial [Archaeoglobaceae archaeon]
LSESSPEILKEEPAKYSLLHLKADLLKEMLKECHFCERRCGIDRYETKGFCKCSARSYYSSEFLHLGEEPEFVPSHTIFFNRCTFACVFCQNYDIVYSDDLIADPKELATLIDIRYRQGSRNVNFVGGNPDQHAHTIAEILLQVNSNIPVVWNSNMFHSEELAEMIEDFVDVWLGDFKYGNNDCALRYSKAPRYMEVVTRNFLRAKENGELLIRHLVMPNHVECCTARVVEWVEENLGENVRFNLMFQYHPTFKAYDYPEISRRLTGEEMRRAHEIASRKLRNLV